MSAEEAALQAQVAPKKESPFNPGKLADVTPEVAEVAAEIAYEKKSELSANKAAMQANINKQFADEVEKAAAPTAGVPSFPLVPLPRFRVTESHTPPSAVTNRTCNGSTSAH